MYILPLDVHGDCSKYNHRQINERVNMNTNRTTRDRGKKQSIEVQQYRE